MFADLHMHSHYSDGTNSPKELVQIAKQNGVSVIALSDHDNVDGINELQNAAAGSGIRAIPAIEISTYAVGLRIHILGYNIDCNNNSLQKYMKEMSERRTYVTRTMLDKLNSMGRLSYTWEQVIKHKPGKTWFSSLDVLDAMYLDGLYASRRQWIEFHQQYFGKNSPAFMSLETGTARSAIEIILEAGGIPVAAHPKLIGDDSQLDALVKYGLQGIEAYYPVHCSEEITKYVHYAKNNNLLITGGTDWHGDFTEWDVELGGCGIDEELLERIL